MQLELWSIWHILYIISPFCIFACIYFFVKGKKEKTKDYVGIVLGIISLAIIIIRNVDIFIRQGWGVEVIPLQVCHVGSIITGLALLTKKKWLIVTSFCFNMIPAILAMIFADALANYDTLWKIRPQTYVWGHIFIVVCALYGIIVHKPSFNKKDLVYSLSFVGSVAVIAIICNSLFRTIFNWTPNYFYLYDYKGTPLKFLYNVFPTSTYGWFSINWFYTIVLLVVFVVVFILLYFSANKITRFLRNKN